MTKRLFKYLFGGMMLTITISATIMVAVNKKTAWDAGQIALVTIIAILGIGVGVFFIYDSIDSKAMRAKRRFKQCEKYEDIRIH